MKSFKMKILAAVMGASLMMVLIVPLFQQEEEAFVERVVSVETMVVSESAFLEVYRSVAVITPKQITQSSFQSVGTITEISVKEGDRVVINQILARIDDEQATLQVQNASQALSTSQFNLQEAKANEQTQKQLLDEAIANEQANLETLRTDRDAAEQDRDEKRATYESNLDTLGADDPETQASLLAANQAELEYQAAQVEYQAALDQGETANVSVARSRHEASIANVNANQSQVSIAENNLQQAQNNLDNTVLRATVTGTVVRVVGNVNDVATPIAPVVIIASDEMKAIFGVPFQWLPVLFGGQELSVFNTTNRLEAKISTIAQLPDQSSRTYEIGVDLPKDSFPIGASVSVEIPLSEVAGVWIPLSSILNDGQPYVFVVENDRAIKRRITLIGFNNTDVRVEGLDENDQVVINGIKSLRSGTPVRVADPS